MNKTSQTHADRLRKLGLPERVVGEVAHAVEHHLFDMEPSFDLVARTIERCRDILPRKDKKSKHTAAQTLSVFADTIIEDIRLASAMSDRSLTKEDRERISAFRIHERLPVSCIATIDFARQQHKPPILLVDNHNVVNPTWWDFNSGFSAMRDSLRIVNKMAAKSGTPPTTVLMVLRPKAQNYSDDEMRALGRTISTATSDIWLIPYGSAGKYKNHDILVGAEDWAIKLEGKPASPRQAFQAFRCEGPAAASVIRTEIIHIASRAFRIRNARNLVGPFADLNTPGRMRELVENVIVRS